MNAFHANWTAPARHRGLVANGDNAVEDFELLTTALSALAWRRWNGSIRMYTDSIAAAYYERHGLLTLWDRGLDTITFDSTCRDIHAPSFWSAGKLLALEQETAPCAMIDTDFIVWEPIPASEELGDVAVIHREDLSPCIYPPEHLLKKRADYKFDPVWDWAEPACNTAFAIFNNENLRAYYVNEALRFMEGNREEASDPVSQAVFSEQRMLGMCAKALGCSVHAFLTAGEDWNSQTLFSHVWGYKDELRRDQETRRHFCRQCLDRIADDFTDILPVLMAIPAIAAYG